jgi:hypothetical protein
LETDQLGGEGWVALGPVLGPARLGHEMLAIHIAELAQSVQERTGDRAPGLGPNHVGGRSSPEHSDSVDLARRLGAGNAGHRKQAKGEAAEEGAPVHQSITHPAPSQK